MPSDKRQIAVRVDDETGKLWDLLSGTSREVMGVPLSQPQLFALALRALAEKWEDVHKRKVTLPPLPRKRE